MVDFHLSGRQISRVKINCFFLDQVTEVEEGEEEGERICLCGC